MKSHWYILYLENNKYYSKNGNKMKLCDENKKGATFKDKLNWVIKLVKRTINTNNK